MARGRGQRYDRPAVVCLYRAVGQLGQLLDVLAPQKRDSAVTAAFHQELKRAVRSAS